MKIGKATFDCTIGMPGFSNVKPGAVEIILEAGEEVEDAWSELNRRALAWHKKEFPHLYEESVPLKSHFVNTEPKYSGPSTGGQQDDEAAVQLGNAIKEMQKIQYKEDAEVFLTTEKWMKYNKELKSLLNAKPNKPPTNE